MHEKEIDNRLNTVKLRMNKALQSRKESHCPILGSNHKNEPYLIGTGVLLEHNSTLFIVSAAHVFDEKEVTTIHTFLNEEVSAITGELHCTVMPENDRDKDRFDIAVFRINNDQDSAFRSAYTPLSIEDVDVNDIPSEKKYYAFVGHPTNKTKPKYGTFIVKSEMYSYTGSVGDDSAYEELSLFPFFHIVVNFDSTKCLNGKGERYRGRCQSYYLVVLSSSNSPSREVSTSAIFCGIGGIL